MMLSGIFCRRENEAVVRELPFDIEWGFPSELKGSRNGFPSNEKIAMVIEAICEGAPSDIRGGMSKRW